MSKEIIGCIIREETPCWYEISINKESLSLVLKVHTDILDDVHVFDVSHKLIASSIKSGSFGCCMPDMKGDRFGFDGVAKKIDVDDNGFVIFVIENPEDDTKKLRAISETLYLFFWLLQFPEKKTSSSLLQLLKIALEIHEQGKYYSSTSYPIWGEYGISLYNLLRTFEDRSVVPEVLETMKAFYKKIGGPYYDEPFKVYLCLGDGKMGLSAQCPGVNGCYVHPQGRSSDRVGDMFACHNVDNVRQQLTLVAALAAFHDWARERM